MLGKALQIGAGGNSSVVWPDISTAAFVRFDAGAGDAAQAKYGIFFKPDGTRMYVLQADDKLVECDLSTAWDISTHGSATYTMTTDQTNNDVPGGLFINNDGTEIYICNRTGAPTNSRGVNQYTMTTAWDLSTASYTRFFDTSTQENTPNGVAFSEDGLNMYVAGPTDDTVNRYTLTTAWDISTASHTSAGADLTGLSPAQYGTQSVFLKPDGSKIFVVGQSSQYLYQWNLSTPNDSSGIDLTPDSTFRVNNEEVYPTDMYISPDGAHMYVTGSLGNGIDQYSLG